MHQGQTHTMHAPGLKRMKRHNGRIEVYWVADEALVKKGFQPKTARIHGLDWNLEPDRVEIAAMCRRFQAEMVEWAGGAETSKNTHGLGTIAWICTAFEVDEDSPYRERRAATQKFYSENIRKIIATVGSRQIGGVIGKDVRRWRHNGMSAMACAAGMPASRPCAAASSTAPATWAIPPVSGSPRS